MKVIDRIIYTLKIYYSVCVCLPAGDIRSSGDVVPDLCEPPNMGAGIRFQSSNSSGPILDLFGFVF